MEERERKFETRYLFDLSYDAYLSEVSRIPRDAIVIVLSIFSDGAGKFFIPREVATTLVNLSPAPVYSPYVNWVGTGIIGGAGETFESMGETAADIVLEILAGRSAASIPPRANPENAYRVDFRSIQRWGLRESNLPPDTIVMYKEPSFWALYRRYIIGAIALIVLQTLLIAGLLVQRASRRMAEAGILVRESALRKSYEQVRQLAGRLIGAQEEERTRIARDLHDDLGQRIASLSIGLSSLKRRVPESEETLRTDVSRLQQQTMDLAKDLRDLSHHLHPGVLQHAGLVAALKEHCSEFRRQHGIETTFSPAESVNGVPADIALCLYRVTQEALRNIADHAAARTVSVALNASTDAIELIISDDGRGFRLDDARTGGGLGLLSLDERVRLLGGALEVDTAHQRGTKLRAHVPLRRLD
jgi:signal transduction histidine kinase